MFDLNEKPRHGRDNKDPILDFTLDVLDGCIHKCSGCNVIKQHGRTYTDEEHQRITSLLNQIEKEGWLPVLLVIGPVDFLTAENTLEVFQKASSYFNRFKSIGLSSTLTYKKEVLLKLLAPLAPYLENQRIKFNVPISPRNINNKLYHDTVKENIKIIQEYFPKINIGKVTYQVNIEEYPLTEDNPILRMDRTGLSDTVKDMDIVIPTGRSDLNDLNNRLRLKSILKHIKDIHLNHFKGYSKDRTTMSRFYDEFIDIESLDLLYTKGRLYRTGFYGDEIVVLHPRFSIDIKDFTTVENFTTQAEAEQFSIMPDECVNCDKVMYCVHHNTLSLMDLLKVKECIYPKDNFKYV